MEIDKLRTLKEKVTKTKEQLEGLSKKLDIVVEQLVEAIEKL